MQTLKWSATALAVVAGVLVASKTEYTALAFPLFLVTHVLWTAIAWSMRENSLMAAQLWFAAIDCLGIYRWLLQGA